MPTTNDDALTVSVNDLLHEYGERFANRGIKASRNAVYCALLLVVVGGGWIGAVLAMWFDHTPPIVAIAVMVLSYVFGRKVDAWFGYWRTKVEASKLSTAAVVTLRQDLPLAMLAHRVPRGEEVPLIDQLHALIKRATTHPTIDDAIGEWLRSDDGKEFRSYFSLFRTHEVPPG